MLRTAVKGGRVVKHEVFAESGLVANEKVRGPVDIGIMPDGALRLSDDHAGTVSRIGHHYR